MVRKIFVGCYYAEKFSQAGHQRQAIPRIAELRLAPDARFDETA
jgi:hypothetical protein